MEASENEWEERTDEENENILARGVGGGKRRWEGNENIRGNVGRDRKGER